MESDRAHADRRTIKWGILVAIAVGSGLGVGVLGPVAAMTGLGGSRDAAWSGGPLRSGPPVAGGTEAGVPPSSRVELTDEVEEVGGRGIARIISSATSRFHLALPPSRSYPGHADRQSLEEDPMSDQKKTLYERL